VERTWETCGARLGLSTGGEHAYEAHSTLNARVGSPLQVNGAKTESCRQTIKLLTSNPSLAQLRLFSKVGMRQIVVPLCVFSPHPEEKSPACHAPPAAQVVHGGWMHKLGEGLGGWTTRYFTLTYELDPTSQPRAAGSGNTASVTQRLDAQRERPRATSVAAQASNSVLVHLHKSSRADKLGAFSSWSFARCFAMISPCIAMINTRPRPRLCLPPARNAMLFCSQGCLSLRMVKGVSSSNGYTMDTLPPTQPLLLSAMRSSPLTASRVILR
jgi:hypothetical protein